MDSATAEWNDVVGIEIATILGAQAGAQRLSIIIDRFLSRGSTFSATLPTENLVASLSLGGISCDAGKVRPVDSTGAGGGLVAVKADLGEESINGVAGTGGLMGPRTRLRMRSMVMGMMMRMTLLLITTGTIGGRGGGVTGVRAFFAGVWHNCNRLLLTDKSLCHIDFFFLICLLDVGLRSSLELMLLLLLHIIIAVIDVVVIDLADLSFAAGGGLLGAVGELASGGEDGTLLLILLMLLHFAENGSFESGDCFT